MQRAAFLLGAALLLGGCASHDPDLKDCATLARQGFRPLAKVRSQRFLGKVQEVTARCRGGDEAVDGRGVPWVDWQNYWATGDARSRNPTLLGTGHLAPNGRGDRRRRSSTSSTSASS